MNELESHELMRIQNEPHADKTRRRLRAIYHLQTTLLETREHLMQFDEFWNRIWSPIEQV